MRAQRPRVGVPEGLGKAGIAAFVAWGLHLTEDRLPSNRISICTPQSRAPGAITPQFVRAAQRVAPVTSGLRKLQQRKSPSASDSHTGYLAQSGIFK
jgi:hypothetical protein